MGALAASAGRTNTNAIAEVKLVSPEASIGPGEADLVLSYDGTLSMADAAPSHGHFCCCFSGYSSDRDGRGATHGRDPEPREAG